MTRTPAPLGLHGISKSFGAVQVLQPLQLNVQAGEMLALLGPSGCGKTTTLQLIAERGRRTRVGAKPHSAFGPEREAHELVWTETIYAELTAILAQMPVHSRSFMESKLFELLPQAASSADAMAALRAKDPEVPAP